MPNKIFSGLFLIILLNLLIKPFYIFGIDAQVQNQVATADYGLYFTLLNLSFLFNILLDVGINNYNSKNIAQHPQLFAKYIGGVLSLRLLLGLVYLMVTLTAGLILGYSNYAIEILFFLGLNQFFIGLILYFRSNFTGMHLFKTDAVFSVLDRLLLILFCLFLLHGTFFETTITILQFVYAQSLAYALAATAAVIYTLTKKRVALKINKLVSYAILKHSAPYALLILLMMLYSRTDVIMIDLLLKDGQTQAGIYAQGFRLLDAASIFALLFAGILLPVFARLIKQKENVLTVLQPAAKLLMSTAILVALICFVFNTEIMQLIYVKDTALSAKPFKWIILTFIPLACTYIFGTLLTANGSLKALNSMAFVGLFINLSLNAILIPLYKAEGAAFATLITQTLTALAQIAIAFKLFSIKIDFIITIKLILLGLITYAIAIYLHPFNSIISNLLLITAIGLGYMFFTKLIHLKAIRSLF